MELVFIARYRGTPIVTLGGYGVGRSTRQGRLVKDGQLEVFVMNGGGSLKGASAFESLLIEEDGRLAAVYTAMHLM